jgi:hypothetical protein
MDNHPLISFRDGAAGRRLGNAPQGAGRQEAADGRPPLRYTEKLVTFSGITRTV